MALPLVIGIDIGTTTSCVAVLRHPNKAVEVIPNELKAKTSPSYVSYDEDDEVIAGQAAKDVALENIERTVFDIKRLVGQSYYDPDIEKYMKHSPFKLVSTPQGSVGVQIGEKIRLLEEIADELISYLQTIAEDFLDAEIKYAAITVPALFNSVQRALVEEAGRNAGFEKVHVVSDPIAAVYSYAAQATVPNGKTKNCLIADLGARNLNLSVLEINSNKKVNIKAIQVEPGLGGQTFDDILMDYCTQEFKLEHGVDVNEGADSKNTAVRLKASKLLRSIKLEIETQKCALSSVPSVNVAVSGVDPTKEFSIPVSQEMFDKLIDPQLEKCVAALDSVLKTAGLVKAKINDVVITGGSSHIPKVRQIVSDYFGGKGIQNSIDPDEAIAIGAAVAAFNVFNSKAFSKSANKGKVTLTDDSGFQEAVDALAFPGQPDDEDDDGEGSLLSDEHIKKQIKDLKLIQEIIRKYQSSLEKEPDTKLKIKDWQDGFKKLLDSDSIVDAIGLLYNHPLLTDLSVFLLYKGESTEALELNEKIHAMQSRVYGNDDLRTLSTQFQIARCLYNKEEHGKALESFRHIHEKRHNVLGEEHQDTLRANFYVAMCMRVTKKVSEAHSLLKKVQSRQERLLGPDHIDYLGTQFEIALCLDNLDKFRDALDLFKVVYEKRNKILGARHQDTLAAQYNIACILDEQDKPKKALEMYEQIYEIQEEELGPSHPDTALTRRSIRLCKKEK